MNLFSNNMVSFYKFKRLTLKNSTGKLSALDPTAILNRGYGMTLKLPELKLVSSVDTIAEKDQLKLILKDGAVKCEVIEKLKENK